MTENDQGEDALPRVLVLDDDAMVQRMVEVAIPDARLKGVSTLDEARQELASTLYDAVIVDLSLPDGDGREILTEIRDHPDSTTLPVVVLSGAGDRSNQLDCFRLGADEFFVKPVDPEILGAAVARQLSRASAVEQRVGAAMGQAPRPSDESSDEPRPDSRVSGTRVLVVEDDPTTAALVRHRLTREGMTLELYADGGEALSLFLEEGAAADYDLVILDLKLPGVGGLELLRELRARPTWKRLPVLVLTGMGGDADVVEAFDLGANDYMVKPFSPPELVARIQRLLRDR